MSGGGRRRLLGSGRSWRGLGSGCPTPRLPGGTPRCRRSSRRILGRSGGGGSGRAGRGGLSVEGFAAAAHWFCPAVHQYAVGVAREAEMVGVVTGDALSVCGE